MFLSFIKNDNFVRNIKTSMDLIFHWVKLISIRKTVDVRALRAKRFQTICWRWLKAVVRKSVWM